MPPPYFEGKKVRREELINFDGKELLFASCVDKEEQIFLFAQLSKTGEVKPYKELGRIFLEGKDPVEVVIIKKNDKLFIHNQNSKARKNLTHFYTFVLNKNLQVEVTNKIKLDLPSESYWILKCEIDRLENWHLLIKNKKEKENTNGDFGKGFEYRLYSLLKGSLQQVKIEPESKEIRQIQLTSQGDDLIISGFYNNRIVTGPKDWQTITIEKKQSGIFYGRVNTSEPFKLKIITSDFGPEFTDVEGKKDSYTISNDFLLQDITVMENGNSYIFSEDISVDSPSNTPMLPVYYSSSGIFMAGGSSETKIYFRNILIIELDKDGNIKRHMVVRKKQDGKESLIPFCSYFKSVKNGKIRLIFSDDNRNIPGQKKILHFKNSNYGMTVVCTIDEQSNEKREVVDSTDDIGLIKISELIKKSESEFIVYKCNTREETFKFGVLKLE
ncbi:hypothetical protein [Sporocytophaga myxococcoides]|uniref:hypothetical protein n=1 Tax=Sporocytophaga myxococcoides TaxID=153721 RepID=UPI00040BD301|nr:hypothetical protein [Sporocytophaga myxococcoides]